MQTEKLNVPLGMNTGVVSVPKNKNQTANNAQLAVNVSSPGNTLGNLKVQINKLGNTLSNMKTTLTKTQGGRRKMRKSRKNRKTRGSRK